MLTLSFFSYCPKESFVIDCNRASREAAVDDMFRGVKRSLVFDDGSEAEKMQKAKKI